MNKKQITSRLKKILNREDVERGGILTRKVSQNHSDEIEVLLEHVILLIADLRFEASACRREMFEARSLLEE